LLIPRRTGVERRKSSRESMAWELGARLVATESCGCFSGEEALWTLIQVSEPFFLKVIYKAALLEL
jgi:hypothetical protein